MPIPKIDFGQTGERVTRVGLGGEGVLRTHDREAEAAAVIQRAFETGITYFDSAAAYAGSQGYYGRFWRDHAADRTGIFQTSKSARRDAAGALAELERTLFTMNLEYLDLWQIHDLRTEDDLAAIAAPGGALEGFLRAKERGKVRFIGVTGHHDPYILTKAVMEWPVDAVLLPVNPVEAAIGGFLDMTLPAAREKGLAVIGMKVLGGGHYLAPQARVGAAELIRFALAQDVDLVIAGCSTPAEVDALVEAGAQGRLDPDGVQAMTDLYRPAAQRMAFYRGRI